MSWHGYKCSPTFFSPCPLGGTVTTPLIYCWCIHGSCCRKWAWKWAEMCVWLWPFLISPDKEHQAFCFLMTSVAFLYPPCCTIYKPDTKHDKKKNGHEQWKMAPRRLFFSYSNSNPGRLGGSHLSCRGLIKKTLSAGMKFPSRHFAPHTYSPLGETKGPLTARL